MEKCQHFSFIVTTNILLSECFVLFITLIFILLEVMLILL